MLSQVMGWEKLNRIDLDAWHKEVVKGILFELQNDTLIGKEWCAK